MEIGDKIKRRRLELGLSQEELAYKVGYKSRSSINKIEIDGRGLPQKKIVKLANALQTTPAYLMGWENKDDFANNLMFFIRRTQTTKTEICQLLNISISTFQNWLSGSEYPTDEQLEKLSNILGVSKDNLTTYNQILVENSPPLNLRKGKQNSRLNELYKQIDDNDLLISLFDKTKDLQEEDLEQILKIIDTFNKK